MKYRKEVIEDIQKILEDKDFVEYLEGEFVSIPEDFYELSDDELLTFVESVKEYHENYE